MARPRTKVRPGEVEKCYVANRPMVAGTHTYEVGTPLSLVMSRLKIFDEDKRLAFATRMVSKGGAVIGSAPAPSVEDHEPVRHGMTQEEVESDE